MAEVTQTSLINRVVDKSIEVAMWLPGKSGISYQKHAKSLTAKMSLGATNFAASTVSTAALAVIGAGCGTAAVFSGVFSLGIIKVKCLKNLSKKVCRLTSDLVVGTTVSFYLGYKTAVNSINPGYLVQPKASHSVDKVK